MSMRVAYRRLFRVRVRHSWYPDELTREDFAVVPTASTAALLQELGVPTRMHTDGVTAVCEVEPDTAPAGMRRPFGPTSLRFAFELRAQTPALLNITEGLMGRPSRTIFCFDNLREDIDSERRHLGDRVADQRIGAPLALVTGSTFVHRLAAAATSATLTVRDRFDAVIATIEAASPDPAVPQTDYRLDLAAIPALVPGRYRITDHTGGVSSIYFDPDLARSRPLGIIEIFTRTDALTPDETDRVPAAYRFVADDAVTSVDYYLQFQALATTWRYIVAKKYDNNGIALGQLLIGGPIAFTPAVSGSQAVFTSSAAVRLSAARRAVKLLREPDREIRDLPNPGLTTPIGADPMVPNFVSDMFVSV
jgi:hypothetical protein